MKVSATNTNQQKMETPEPYPKSNVHCDYWIKGPPKLQYMVSAMMTLLPRIGMCVEWEHRWLVSLSCIPLCTTQNSQEMLLLAGCRATLSLSSRSLPPSSIPEPQLLRRKMSNVGPRSPCPQRASRAACSVQAGTHTSMASLRMSAKVIILLSNKMIYYFAGFHCRMCNWYWCFTCLY